MGMEKDRLYREVSGIRDMIESVWVAIVLAFVLRAFMIEAFVIPTGSMAPRLVGEHLDHRCLACGYRYAFGMADRAGGGRPSGDNAGCPNCNSSETRNRSYVNGGDRVLVLKYLYHFAAPRPWDVVVFRNPQNNRENYIKRLVGLPGEMIEIVHGDIFFRVGKDRNGDGVIDRNDFDFNGDGRVDADDLADPAGLKECPWQIRRKPPHVQRAVWHLVFDNDYRPDAGQVADAPEWVPGRNWTPSEDGRNFTFHGGAGKLTFRAAVNRQVAGERFFPRYGYNRGVHSIDLQIDICTDLKLSAVMIPRARDASLSLVLTSFENRFEAEVRADGEVRLVRTAANGAGPPPWTARIGRLRTGRGYEVALEHVDFGVTLWVDGRAAIALDAEQLYGNGGRLKAELAERLRQVSRRPIPSPQVAFLGRRGACELRHVKLMRDVYYTAANLDSDQFRKDGTAYGPVLKYAREALRDARANPDSVRNQWTRDPQRSGGDFDAYMSWGTWGNPIVLARHPGAPDLDEFFVLGDNSPQSLDGRCWTKAAPTLRLYERDSQGRNLHDRPIYKLGTVPRYNMIGKALFVYWPAGFRIPGLERLPVIPNAGKMRLIR